MNSSVFRPPRRRPATALTGSSKRGAVGVGERGVGLGDAVPALVAVHGEVAAADGGDAARRRGSAALQACDVVGAGLRRGVAAVGEGVHARSGRRRRAGSCASAAAWSWCECTPPGETRPIRWQVPSDCLQLGDQVGQRRGLGEAAVGDRVADAHQFLLHHAAGADVHVADLGVAHLAVGQADVAAGGVQQGVRAGLPQAGRRWACARGGRRCPRLPRASRSRRGSPASPGESAVPWLGSLIATLAVSVGVGTEQGRVAAFRRVGDDRETPSNQVATRRTPCRSQGRPPRRRTPRTHLLSRRNRDGTLNAPAQWNDVLETIVNHRSVRGFLPDALPAGTLELLIAAAQSASTSSNLQLWSVVAIEEPGAQGAPRDAGRRPAVHPRCAAAAGVAGGPGADRCDRGGAAADGGGHAVSGGVHRRRGGCGAGGAERADRRGVARSGRRLHRRDAQPAGASGGGVETAAACVRGVRHGDRLARSGEGDGHQAAAAAAAWCCIGRPTMRRRRAMRWRTTTRSCAGFSRSRGCGRWIGRSNASTG